MKAYIYLLVNIGCIAIPVIASFYKKHAFFNDWKSFFKANILVTILFLVWDILFTQAGIWGFNPEYLTGLYFFNLPIEEVLFFICIPYACVFSFFAFEYLIKHPPLQKSHKFISILLIILLLTIAVFNYNKLYTSITFFSTSLFLAYLLWGKRNLSLYYLSYLFIIPFFILSNGILTGSFFVDPIVWYNNDENLGIRLVNIPIEDIIYGMLLVFMNIELFTYYRQKTHL